MMTRNITIYLVLALAVLLGIGAAVPRAAQAQQENRSSLDAALAQAAGKGFLITLVRPELSSTQKFYLLDSVNVTGIIADLGQVTGFEIVEAGWVNDESYQVKATLQPGRRSISVFSGKYDGRWRVEGVELAAANVSNGGGETSTVSTGTTGSRVQPVSGNGSGILVFQTQSGGDFYRINADGTGLQRISHGIDPQLSPDGNQVAFTRWEPRYELFTINIDGTGERALTHNWRQMKSPTWTADGTSLIFSYQEGGRLDPEYRRVELEDAIESGDTIDISREARGVEVEDGILKYVIPADAHWHLKKIDLTSGELTDLGTERHSYGPTGHPSDKNLVAYKGQQGIALNNTATQTDQPISTDHRDHTPVISPDGSKVAVSYWQDGHWEVHTMNLAGSNRQRLTTTPLTVVAQQGGIEQAEVDGKVRFVAKENPWWNNAAPTWSPDGSQIAFMTDRTGQWEIWIMNADGSNPRPMFSNGALADLTFNYAGVDERMLSWR
jgi:hypothetical protein